MPVNDIIVKQLNQKNHKGFVLLHGKQGTGKTTYIRYLISKVKKQVIFMPVNLIHELTSPKMLEFLVDYPNVIFVIEDAENIMQDRNRNMSSPVSTLLNISDGLLSDCLNIQLICTFNAPVSPLDFFPVAFLSKAFTR